MHCSKVSAVIVTRGGYDISEVIQSLSAFGEIRIWDNSKRDNRRVYGRFIAASEALFDVVYVADDDCIVDAAAVVAAYQRGNIVTNWPSRHREVNANLYAGGIAPLGWGAIFDRSLVGSFASYFAEFPCDELFERECDRVFTALNEVRIVDTPYRNLDRAEFGMWRQKRHLDDFSAIKQRIVALKAAA